MICKLNSMLNPYIANAAQLDDK